MVQTLGGETMLSVSGEIDMAAVAGMPPGLLVKLLDAVAGAGSVTCDLREVGFMDSSGIHLLVKLRDELIANGCGFQVLRPGATVSRMFEIVNAGALFEIVEAPA
jgi:anti-anti-sigma factor